MALTPQSIRARVVLATALISLGTTAVFVIAMQVLLARSASNDSLGLLQARVDAVGATIDVVGGEPAVRAGMGESLDQNVWVYDLGGRLVDGPRSSNRVAAVVAEMGSTQTEQVRKVGDRHRFYARPIVKDGRPVAVAVAGLDLSPYEHAESRALWYSLALGVLGVVAASLAASAATRYSLGKVRVMARTADDWREHNLHRRFELAGPNDELSELGATLDRMLGRIEQTILAERRLTDELAHELRTPLSVVRSEAELGLLGEHTSVSDEAFRSILTSADAMRRSITVLLDVARSVEVGRDVCAVQDLLELARSNAPTRDGVAVEAESSSLSVGAPLHLAAAALAPLVDNAVRHANARVILRASANGSQVMVNVADDGTGITNADAPHAFEPGWTSAGGAGLGLPLARRLARSVGGDIKAHSPGHGLFTLVLPQHEGH
jgi:signal transduction histidine kinase